MRKLILLSLLLTACGQYKTDPLRDHKAPDTTKTVNGAEDIKAPPAKEIVIIKEVPVEVPKEVIVIKEVPVEVPKEVIREVPVDRPVYYPTEEAKNFAANQLFQIKNSSTLSFVAGTEGKARFEVRVLQGTVEYTVKALSLPAGAGPLQVVKADGNLRVVEFAYKPTANVIDPTQMELRQNLKLQLNIISIKGKDEKNTKELSKAFAAVSTAKEFEYVVRRDNSAPKVMELSGLPASINEGDKASFSIRFEAPGTYVGYEPTVYVVNDKSPSAGNYFENSGVGFISESSSRKAVEYVSDGVWIANFDLDTKTFPVPQQLDRQLKPVADAKTVSLKFAVFVSSPAGTKSDTFVQRFQIVYKPKEVTPPQPVPQPTPAPEATPDQAPSTPNAPPKEVPLPSPKPAMEQPADSADTETP